MLKWSVSTTNLDICLMWQSDEKSLFQLNFFMISCISYILKVTFPARFVSTLGLSSVAQISHKI